MSLKFFERSDLARALLNFRREFIWVGVFSLVTNLLMLIPSLYMMQLFDRVLISRSELTLLFLTIIIVVLLCVGGFAEWLRSRLLVRAGVRFDQALNKRIFNASFEANLAGNKGSGGSAFSNLIKVRQFLTGNGIIAFFDAPWMFFYIFILFVLHPLLGVMAIVFCVIQLAIAVIGAQTTRASVELAYKSEVKTNQYLRSKLKNAEPVEAMGMLSNLRKRWLTFHIIQQEKNDAARIKQQHQQTISKFVRYCMQSFTLGAAALLVINGELSAGAMIAANILMTRALQPLELIVGSWSGLIQAKISFEALEKLLEDYPERNLSLGRPSPSGQVTLNKLVAKSPSRETAILKGLDLTFKAGDITVIIGPSGAGKSTLARCLVGIWPDKEGFVLLDGIPIEHWSRDQLGAHIGYLPQDIEILEGSIAENIGRFNEMDSEKVIEAAKRAGIHEMILRLPMGYDTTSGQIGEVLSGGQRQRIGLARAVYGEPTIIVLDEPNANLDEVGDLALVKAIVDLKKQGKTVFLITHRPNIIGVADNLLVMKDGTITHFGSREDVLLSLNSSVGNSQPAKIEVK